MSFAYHSQVLPAIQQLPALLDLTLVSGFCAACKVNSIALSVAAAMQKAPLYQQTA